MGTTFDYTTSMLARSVTRLSLVLVAFAAGCAAPSEDDTGDQTSNVTGGSGTVESPVVYVFDSLVDQKALPKCAGAIIGEKIVVTAKGCSKEGMFVGRAADKNGRAKTARVKAVHTPPGADADIEAIELDDSLGGVAARITHMPLRDGYAVDSVASADSTGILAPFEPKKGEASSIKASMIDEDRIHATLLPAKDTTICDNDIGAPVCSSTGFNILGHNVAGTCGLSGVVIGRASGTQPAGTKGAVGCSSAKWKVASLGRYAEFLKPLAPKAFEPLRIDEPILRELAYVPEGLWGYKTKGDVKECKITTTKLDGVAPNVVSARIDATASFASMDKYAAAFGRLGIAPKSDPSKMTWLPARKVGDAKGESFSANFEGVVSAEAAGDYLVVFRASANGGESWVECDTDGLANGFTLDKALALKVGDPSSANTPPPGNGSGSAPSTSSPQSDPPPPAESQSEDPSADSEPESPTSDSKDPSNEKPAAKKASNGGCSQTGGSPLGSSLPAFGALLATAALARRRRQLKAASR